MRVSLPPALEDFVREKVDSGLYQDADEVVRAALRLMRETEALSQERLGRLRLELAKGDADIAAGRGVTLTSKEELATFFARQ